MSKCYLGDIKVKAGVGADDRYHVEVECAEFGTMHKTGATAAEAVAQLVDAMSTFASRDRDEIERLRAALRLIAAPTYGTEIMDSDAERAEIYWTHIKRMQGIAKDALQPPETKP